MKLPRHNFCISPPAPPRSSNALPEVMTFVGHPNPWTTPRRCYSPRLLRRPHRIFNIALESSSV
jgi:hypothetical protein